LRWGNVFILLSCNPASFLLLALVLHSPNPSNLIVWTKCPFKLRALSRYKLLATVGRKSYKA